MKSRRIRRVSRKHRQGKMKNSRKHINRKRTRSHKKRVRGGEKPLPNKYNQAEYSDQLQFIDFQPQSPPGSPPGSPMGEIRDAMQIDDDDLNMDLRPVRLFSETDDEDEDYISRNTRARQQ